MNLKLQTKVDKFGRVVIPKEIRVDLGLSPGSLLTVEEHGNELTLRPLSEEPVVCDKGGVLVARCQITGDLESFLKTARKSRLASFGATRMR